LLKKLFQNSPQLSPRFDINSSVPRNPNPTAENFRDFKPLPQRKPLHFSLDIIEFPLSKMEHPKFDTVRAE
jgi:hypothetical protein